MNYILVTGGLGYIGSNTVVHLLINNYNVIIIDNLCNSEINTLDKIKKISNNNSVLFFNIDIEDNYKLNKLFECYNIYTVLHFAGLKSVNESINDPLKYYLGNVQSTLNLLNIMKKHQCKKIIFSSSATVYGRQTYPVSENSLTGYNITNPYGKSKYMIESILQDLYSSDNSWSIVILRYFNPIGAHPSGLLGDNPKDDNNLFPYILKVAKGIYSDLKVFGDDYDTKDGTCMRDFIDINDLAIGHVKSLSKLNKPGIYIYNLATGNGTTILELINTFIKTNDVMVPYTIVDKRIGDIPIITAINDKAKLELDWNINFTLEDSCRFGWEFINNYYNFDN